MTGSYQSKLVEFAQRCREDPVFFATEALGAHLWSMQKDIARSVRDNRRTAVKACHGPGKTMVAATIVHWFLRLPNSRVVTTATTWPQIEKQLWHEIARLHRNARYPLGGRLLKTEYHLDGDRYAIGLSTKPENQESFAGHHAENILLIFDEASGIPQPIFDTGEGYMTTPGARQLLIGNPIRPSGQFYDAFTRQRKDYNTFSISVYDTPNFTGEPVPPDVARRLVSRQWAEEYRNRVGEGSAEWQYRALGEFPKSAENSVIWLSDVEEAQARDIPIEVLHPDAISRIVCDVARFGSDETVIMHRHGYKVSLIETYTGQDTMQTVGRIVNAKADTGATEIVVDDTGVGGGVTDRLRELGHDVIAFNGAETAIESDHYFNARTEIWFNLQQALKHADIPEDALITADLCAPIYKFDSQGRRQLEPKDNTKKRIGRSPDRGDALAMCFAPSRKNVMEVW